MNTFWTDGENEKAKELAISLDREVWEMVNEPAMTAKWKSDYNLDYKSENELRGELLGNLLKRYGRGEINPKSARIKRRIDSISRNMKLDEESSNVYQRLQIGSKSHIVSSLLLIWINEQQESKRLEKSNIPAEVKNETFSISFPVNKEEKEFIILLQEELARKNPNRTFSEGEICRLGIHALRQISLEEIIRLTVRSEFNQKFKYS